MRPTPERRRAAAALGAASGVRSFAGAAALALRGRPRAGWARAALLTLAGAEAVADKLPVAPPRSDPPGLLGRLGGGAASGAAVAGRRGAAIGASFALATTYASERARALLGARSGLPDPALAAVEDLLTYGSAWLAAGGYEAGDDRLPIHAPGRDASPSPGRAIVAGLAAALVGTAAMTTAQVTYGKLTGAEASDAPRQAGEKLLAVAGVEPVPDARKAALNNAMHLLYGTSWGIPFGLAARRRPGPAAGLALGFAVWSLSLAELPALGLAPPPWRQPPGGLAADLGFHLVYGFAAGAALDALTA